MIRCCNCGATFTEDEVEHRSENVGEFWGAPAYMTIDICPECRSEELEDAEEPDEEEADND